MYPFSPRLAPQPSYDFTGLLAPRPAPVPRDPMIPLSEMNIPSGYATRAFAPVISAGMPDMPSTATSAPTPQPRGLFTGTGSSARLLSLGQSLLAPSRIPTTLGGRIASGLAAGQQAAAEQQKQELAKTLADLQMQEAELRMAKLERESKMLDVPITTGAVTVYDVDTGSPIQARKVKGSRGDISYFGPNNEKLEYGSFSTEKPQRSKIIGTDTFYVGGKYQGAETVNKVENVDGSIVYTYPETHPTKAGQQVDLTTGRFEKPMGERYGEDVVSVRTVIDPEGNVFDAYFDKGRRKTINSETGEVVTGVINLDEAQVPKAQELISLREELIKEENSLASLDKYMEGISKNPAGMQRFINKVSARIKTVLGRTPTQEELQTLISEGRLQGLIGKFRVEVVGPGVMTEQDALRIISALGGDFNIFQSPQAALQLLGSVSDAKNKNYSEILELYNATWDSIPQGVITKRRFKKRKAYERGLFPNETWFGAGGSLEGWNALDTEDKKEFLGR